MRAAGGSAPHLHFTPLSQSQHRMRYRFRSVQRMVNGIILGALLRTSNGKLSPACWSWCWGVVLKVSREYDGGVFLFSASPFCPISKLFALTGLYQPDLTEDPLSPIFPAPAKIFRVTKARSHRSSDGPTAPIDSSIIVMASVTEWQRKIWMSCRQKAVLAE
jgi:hypothetical protein